MARHHPTEVRLAAIRALEDGAKVPVVCRRHGITERTLYRWRREVAREKRGEAGRATAIEGADSSRCEEALRAALESIPGPQRERAFRAMEQLLELPAGSARELLDRLPPRRR